MIDIQLAWLSRSARVIKIRTGSAQNGNETIWSANALRPVTLLTVMAETVVRIVLADNNTFDA